MSNDELAQSMPWRKLTEQREERLSLLRLSRVVKEEDEVKTKAKSTFSISQMSNDERGMSIALDILSQFTPYNKQRLAIMKNQEFHFEDIGRRMPYKVPEGFFDHLEESIKVETGLKPRHHHGIWLAIPTVVAAAAVALFLILTRDVPDSNSVTASYIHNIEIAYNELSTEDQIYLEEVCDDDIFLNDITVYKTY